MHIFLKIRMCRFLPKSCILVTIDDLFVSGRSELLSVSNLNLD
jgi:hypothetical protein